MYSERFISGNESSLISNDNLEYDFDLSDIIKNGVTLSKAIFRTVCLNWIHIKCNSSSNKEYDLLVLEDDNTPWQCILCNIELNFHLPIQPKWK